MEWNWRVLGMNNKAAVKFTLQMLISLAMLFVVTAIISGIIFYHLNIKIDSHKPQADLFVETLLSPNGIGYRDYVTQRWDPRIVDEEKFKKIEKLPIQFENQLGARISMRGEVHHVNKPFFERMWVSYELEHERKKQKRGVEKIYIGLDGPIALEKGAYLYRIPIKLRQGFTLGNEVIEILVVLPRE